MGSRRKFARLGERKKYTPRHRRLSQASADRCDRVCETAVRQDARREIEEQAAEREEVEDGA
jgi:hypothetical protein